MAANNGDLVGLKNISNNLIIKKIIDISQENLNLENKLIELKEYITLLENQSK